MDYSFHRRLVKYEEGSTVFNILNTTDMNPNLIGKVQGEEQREAQDPLLSIMPHPLFPGICGATVAGVRS